ncbi:MAG: hypothetical protein V4683_14155 [Bacteroidota bacterium]
MIRHFGLLLPESLFSVAFVGVAWLLLTRNTNKGGRLSFIPTEARVSINFPAKDTNEGGNERLALPIRVQERNTAEQNKEYESRFQQYKKRKAATKK